MADAGGVPERPPGFVAATVIPAVTDPRFRLSDVCDPSMEPSEVNRAILRATPRASFVLLGAVHVPTCCVLSPGAEIMKSERCSDPLNQVVTDSFPQTAGPQPCRSADNTASASTHVSADECDLPTNTE